MSLRRCLPSLPCRHWYTPRWLALITLMPLAAIAPPFQTYGLSCSLSLPLLHWCRLMAAIDCLIRHYAIDNTSHAALPITLIIRLHAGYAYAYAASPPICHTSAAIVIFWDEERYFDTPLPILFTRQRRHAAAITLILLATRRRCRATPMPLDAARYADMLLMPVCMLLPPLYARWRCHWYAMPLRHAIATPLLIITYAMSPLDYFMLSFHLILFQIVAYVIDADGCQRR